MEITTALKKRVISAMDADMTQRGMKQNDYARYMANMLSIKLDKSAFPQMKTEVNNGGEKNIINPTSWMKIARYLGVLDNGQWMKADTRTFKTIELALNFCKDNGVWQVLCDKAGVGKTFAAKYYAAAYKDSVVYIDCSQCLTKNDFIMELARMLGVERATTYGRLWHEATDQLLLMNHPLLILDEFGDVPDSVITLLKSLYNKADIGDYMSLAVYMIGADNLEKRLVAGQKNRRQSYAEFWSRFDWNVTKLGFSTKGEALLSELEAEIGLIVDANIPEELAHRRKVIIDKTLSTHGSRAVRKNINIERVIHNLTTV